jgi:hypothetical protein
LAFFRSFRSFESATLPKVAMGELRPLFGNFRGRPKDPRPGQSSIYHPRMVCDATAPLSGAYSPIGRLISPPPPTLHVHAPAQRRSNRRFENVCLEEEEGGSSSGRKPEPVQVGPICVWDSGVAVKATGRGCRTS